jgi:hypothetical protein
MQAPKLSPFQLPNIDNNSLASVQESGKYDSQHILLQCLEITFAINIISSSIQLF